MKDLINYIIIFSKIISLNFLNDFSPPFIKKSIYSLLQQQISLRFRLTNKHRYNYSLNPSFSFSQLKKSKLFYTLVNIPPVLFFSYFRRSLSEPALFNPTIMKKHCFQIYQNFIKILNDHLHTDITSFTKDFRMHLKSYKLKIQEIETYLKINSLKQIPNTAIFYAMETPASDHQDKKKKFYPRYIVIVFIKNLNK